VSRTLHACRPDTLATVVVDSSDLRRPFVVRVR
jgi:hypothetical protein